MAEQALGSYYFKTKDCPVNICRISRSEGITHDHDLTEIEHYHDFVEIVAIVNGQGMQVVEDHEYPVSAGDVFVLQGNQRHYFMDAGNVEIVNVMFDDKAVSGLVPGNIRQIDGYRALFVVESFYRARHHFRNMLHLSRSEMSRIEILLNEMMQEQNQQSPGFEIILMNRLQEYIIQLSRYYSAIKNSGAQSLLRLAKVLDFLETNYSEKIYIDRLADSANMSKRNFQRIFKRAMGMSPINYLMQVRLQKARKLLRESGYDMNDVAVMCGFSDSNYFIKCFKEAYHTTPLKFRQKFV